MLLATAPTALGLARAVRWTSARTLTKPVAQRRLREYLSEPRTIETLLALNPTLRTYEELDPAADGSRAFRAKLAPVAFPGATVTPTVDFVARLDGAGTVSMSAVNASTVGEGPPFFQSLMERLVPEIESTTTLTVVPSSSPTALNEELLLVDGTLTLSFPLPAWWPVPDLVMNGAGGKIMSKVLDEELETLAEGYIATYDSWRGAVAANELAGDDITQAASRDASAGKRLRSWRPWRR